MLRPLATFISSSPLQNLSPNGMTSDICRQNLSIPKAIRLPESTAVSTVPVANSNTLSQIAPSLCNIKMWRQTRPQCVVAVSSSAISLFDTTGPWCVLSTRLDFSPAYMGCFTDGTTRVMDRILRSPATHCLSACASRHARGWDSSYAGAESGKLLLLFRIPSPASGPPTRVVLQTPPCAADSGLKVRRKATDYRCTPLRTCRRRFAMSKRLPKLIRPSTASTLAAKPQVSTSSGVSKGHLKRWSCLDDGSVDHVPALCVKGPCRLS